MKTKSIYNNMFEKIELMANKLLEDMVEAKEVSKLPVKNSNTDINKLLFRVMESVL